MVSTADGSCSQSPNPVVPDPPVVSGPNSKEASDEEREQCRDEEVDTRGM